LYGLQLVGNSDGFTSPTVDDSFNPGVTTNLIGNSTPGSGGVYGLLLQGVNGKYDHITINNTTSSSLFMSGVNNPTPWDDATIVLNNSPSPWTLRTNLPATVGTLGSGSTDLGYSAGTLLTENYVQMNNSLSDMTLVADPLNAGSVWRVDTSVTIPAGVTLSVNDGAIIKFDLNQTLFVDGT